MPHDLARIQRVFLSAVTDGGPATGILADLPGAGSRGLEVYRFAYLARLREALADNYPVFARALGDADFDRIADAYARAHPPTAAELRPYGDQLEAFLGTDPEDGPPWLPHPAFLDLARLDWALRAAFDAADAEPLSTGQLAGLPPHAWPDLRLRLLPGAARIQLEWSVESAWHLLNAAEPGAEPELPAPQPHRHSLLVWRSDLENRWRSVAPLEECLLGQLAEGTTFGALAELVTAGLADAAHASEVLAGHLHQWLADGCLRALTPPGAAPAP